MPLLTISSRIFLHNQRKQGYLQKGVGNVHQWSINWRLPSSKEKTRVLHIGRTRINLKYSIQGRQLEEAQEVTHLGFLLRENYSFDEHCMRSYRNHAQDL